MTNVIPLFSQEKAAPVIQQDELLPYEIVRFEACIEAHSFMKKVRQAIKKHYNLNNRRRRLIWEAFGVYEKITKKTGSVEVHDLLGQCDDDKAEMENLEDMVYSMFLDITYRDKAGASIVPALTRIVEKAAEDLADAYFDAYHAQ